MSSYRFHACDLVTGRRLGVLPLVPQGEVVRGLLAVETLGFTVPVGDPALPAEWAASTRPGRSMIVCERVDDGTIMQGWVVVGRPRGSAGVTLATATLEAYLDRRFVGDHGEWYETDAGLVTAGLVGDANVEGIGLVVDALECGPVDRVYAEADSQSVLAALTELTEAEDGPEIAIDLDWSPDQSSVVKTLQVAPRLGVVDPEGRVRFVAGRAGSVTSYSDADDFTGDHGATRVRAGTDGLLSAPETAADLLMAGWPVWETRTDHPNVVSERQLQGYARRDLRRMKRGRHDYQLTAATDRAPWPRRDFDLGDDVTLVVRPWEVHPQGLQVTARVASWRLDVSAGTLTPVLVDDEAEVSAPRPLPVPVQPPTDPAPDTDPGPPPPGDPTPPPDPDPEPTPEPVDGVVMRIVSANIGHEVSRADKMASTALLAPLCGVYAGQEVNNPDMYDAVDQGFPAATWVRTFFRGNECPVLVKSRTWEVLGRNAYRMHDGLAHAGPARWVTADHLRRRLTSIEFLLLNTHTVAHAWCGEDVPSKQWRKDKWNSHIRLLKSIIRDSLDHGLSVILTGDLNRGGIGILVAGQVNIDVDRLDYMLGWQASGGATFEVLDTAKVNLPSNNHNAQTARLRWKSGRSRVAPFDWSASR